MITYLFASISIAVALTYLYLGYKLIVFNQHTVRLAEQSTDAVVDWPSVSIIVPIHNEELFLVEALTKLCTLDYPNYQIVAVNDRSKDRSESIINKLRQQYQHLKTITVTAVPAGWLGKTHALQQGIEQSTGEYLIFTDADVMFSPILLKQAIAYMVKERLGHLTLAPQLRITNFFSRWFMPFQLLIMALALMPWKAKQKNTRYALGIGAFNGVTRQALNTINGMQSIALNPIDDVGLARSLKQAGVNQGIANPENLLQLPWYGNYQTVVTGFEKNIFAFFDFGIFKAYAALLVYLSFIFMPIVGLCFSSSWLLLANGFSIIFVLTALLYINRQLSVPKFYVLLYPLAAAMTLWTGIRSVLLCLSRRGIYWGGLFVSLAQLKAFWRHNQASGKKSTAK